MIADSKRPPRSGFLLEVATSPERLMRRSVRVQEFCNSVFADDGHFRRLYGSRSKVILRDMDKKPTPSVGELYPNLTERELKEAEENLDRYLLLVLRIFERIESEQPPKVATLTPHTGTLPCTPPQPDSSVELP